ncbi:MAG: sodium:proton antiporter [Alistipes sp.]|nr:sodium:proton antiporter [Alistipes sp.]
MQQIEIWALIPFILMLLSIATMPLIAEKWWEKNSNKLIVAILLSIPASAYLILNGMAENLTHQILWDYIPFITLLTTLFVVTGGIEILGDIQARPRNNTLMLATGYILASLIGTTGASMLLIHPLLRINQQRTHKTHTILFFIALVANCGGILTPLGDPPLFLLYLRGAHFGWFMGMFFEWLFVGGILLAIYYFTDRYIYYKKEGTAAIMADFREKTDISFRGKFNIILLVGVVLSVLYINSSYIPQMNDENAPLQIKFLREIVLIGITLLSLLTTRKSVRKDNNFTWEPIIEVGVVFIGIFITMTPALIFLSQNASRLGITQPWQFFYASGTLSAFLDNSPTAVAFHTVAQSIPSPENMPMVAGANELILKAIALGSVFFGAMTYIGNGPNFMVKAIAEQEGVKMPGFFGYMFKFSLIVLLPIYILVQLIFLR